MKPASTQQPTSFELDACAVPEPEIYGDGFDGPVEASTIDFSTIKFMINGLTTRNVQ